MILYKLGIVSDAFSISSMDIVIALASFAMFFILGIFTSVNLQESSYPDNKIDEFLQDHKLLTFIISFAFAAIAAFSMFLFIEMTSQTAPDTIVESQYILKNSTRTVDVKDSFKTVYENDQNVSFSSQIDNDFYQKLPEDLKHALENHVHFSLGLFSSSHDKDFILFSTDSDMTSIQIDVLKELSKYKQVIEINASKADSSVKILAMIDSIEISKEDENGSNLEYHIDKIEIANAVETISRDDQSKSRDIKSVKLHISGKTSKAAKDRQSIEKLVE